MTMLHRGYKISSNEEHFQHEVNRLKQIFTNNNYPMKIINQSITKFHKKIKDKSNQEPPRTKIKIYYENQMNEQYKKDEKIMKNIITQNVKTNNDEDLEFIIYYKNTKTRNLLMQNNLAKLPDKLLTSWSVYKFSCYYEDCELLNPSYIGQTRNTIRTRLQQHCRDGAIKDHLQRYHRSETDIQCLETHTVPIKQFNDLRRLKIYEALLILHQRPDMNRQKDNFVNPLKLYSRYLPRPRHNPETQTPSTQQPPRYNLRSATRALAALWNLHSKFQNSKLTQFLKKFYFIES